MILAPIVPYMIRLGIVRPVLARPTELEIDIEYVYGTCAIPTSIGEAHGHATKCTVVVRVAFEVTRSPRSAGTAGGTPTARRRRRRVQRRAPQHHPNAAR